MALGKKLSPLFFGLVLLVGLLAFLNWPQEQSGQTIATKLTPVKVYEVSLAQKPFQPVRPWRRRLCIETPAFLKRNR